MAGYGTADDEPPADDASTTAHISQQSEEVAAVDFTPFDLEIATEPMEEAAIEPVEDADEAAEEATEVTEAATDDTLPPVSPDDPARAGEIAYLAHVIACENGPAEPEALKAQAVAARSYLHYKIGASGRIGDGEHDQVYTCATKPESRHYEAVKATVGQVLKHQGNLLAAFYVAGAIPDDDTCVADGDDSDPTRTERFVTYNGGKRGNFIARSPLGDRASLQNRGTKSQNGAHCLARKKGWDYKKILRFYYGDDVELTIDKPVYKDGVVRG